MTQTATTITVDSLPIANSIDPVQDRLLIYTSSATDIQGISRNVLLGLSSQPLGLTDSQSPQNKTFDNTNVLTVKAANLVIQDGTDTTKQAKFIASGITTGNTRSYTLPDISDTLVSLTATQTLTNKTLTAPVTIAISNTGGFSTNGATITGAATIGTTLGVTGNTTLGGTLAVTGTSTFTGAVTLPSATITPSILATGANSAVDNVAGSTTSTTYTSVLSAGTPPTVTVTIGANGLALVSISAIMSISVGPATAFMAWALTGATTLASSDFLSIQQSSGTNSTAQSYVYLQKGLTAGSTTFTPQFRVSSGTGTWNAINISVIPL